MTGVPSRVLEVYADVVEAGVGGGLAELGVPGMLGVFGTEGLSRSCMPSIFALGTGAFE